MFVNLGYGGPLLYRFGIKKTPATFPHALASVRAHASGATMRFVALLDTLRIRSRLAEKDAAWLRGIAVKTSYESRPGGARASWSLSRSPPRLTSVPFFHWFSKHALIFARRT